MVIAASNLQIYNLHSEAIWQELYPLLRSLAKRFVYSFDVTCWHGQEEDLVEDIVQETALRLLGYSERVEHGEAGPIQALEPMIWAIAYRYCIDRRRRDRRLMRITTDGNSPEFDTINNDQVDLSEVAIEQAYYEEIFTLLASEIAQFPYKQRRALLIDLSNRMCFDDQPSSLQAAFIKANIRLQEYRQPLPADHRERSRHSALLHEAYKRVAHLFSCLHECTVA